MSDPESFLSRWSRRKREGRENDTSHGVSPSPRLPSGNLREERANSDLSSQAGKGLDHRHTRLPLPTRGEGEVVAHPPPTSTDPAFDPSSLPPVQSITAETDIRGFLRTGVPPELTRAALRRAFASDPAIRNFVGLADYDWDFNAADSIAGFGPLQMTDDVAKMAAQVLAHVLEPNRTEPRNPLDPAPAIPKAEEAADKADTTAAHSAAKEMHSHATDRDQPANELGTLAHADELTHREQEHVAAQYRSIRPENRDDLVRRQHGGALPK
jgi:Protein of unknown function (DUF3306)